MNIEMIDKWVTSFRFKGERKKIIGFLIDFIFCRMAETTASGFSISHMTLPKVTSVWGVSAVAILDSLVNCVCVWSTKKLTMLAYCVAANCNNSQTTPGITMHELQRNRPAVRQKWIKFIQFKRADFLAAPHHAHLCSEHFSECNFANPMGFDSKLTWFQNPAWQAQNDTAVSLSVSWAKYQFCLRSSSWPFCSDSRPRVT